MKILISRNTSICVLIILIFIILFTGSSIESVNAQTTQGSTIVVSTTVDELNSDGDCSLREAIQSANTDTPTDNCPAGNGADVIELPAGIFTLSIEGRNESMNISGDLDITSDLSIIGSGAKATTVNGNQIDRVFEILNGSNVTIADVTITGGNVKFDNPQSGPESGGGISNNGGNVEIIRSSISENSASSGGGVASLGGGVTTINFTTISNNLGEDGGGIFNGNSSVVVTNSTISGNYASGDGGALFGAGGSYTFSYSTITNNSTCVGCSGGGFWISQTDQSFFKGTIIAGNHGAFPSDKDCYFANSPISQGYNIVGECMNFQPTSSDQVVEDPLLGPLADNGSNTQTHEPLLGSPAINAGPVDCPPPATDQRGVTRPQSAACDVGAFEVAFEGVEPPDFTPTDEVVIPPNSSIQIAVVTDLTGPAASIYGIGPTDKLAAQMAIEDFGDILGYDVQPIFYDGQCYESGGIQAGEQIVMNPNFVAVIGHTCSAGTMAVLPWYEQAGIVTISGSASVDFIHYYGPAVFNRTIPPDSVLGTWIENLQLSQAVIDWNAIFNSRWGESPDILAPLFYDAAMLILTRISEIGTVDLSGNLVINRADMAASVRGTTAFQGVSGCIAFDEFGNRIIMGDLDGDGVQDNCDNAPNSYNPDQSDIDGDGIGDVADECPNDASNTCDPYGSAADYIIAEDGGSIETADGSVSISLPPGSMSANGSVSITDTDDGSTGFELTTNRGNLLGVFSVELKPSQTFDVPILITFEWEDINNDGVVDGTNISEDKLIVTKDNVAITNQCDVELLDDGVLPDCDMDANTFTFEVSSWSEFALAYTNDPEVTSIITPTDPVSITNLPTIIGSFTDADDDDSHTAVWDWGDGTTSVGIVNHEDNLVYGGHEYSEPGVYVIDLTVTDAFPNSGSLTSDFVVVYDPDGGFVTGGGWIDSPVGAYAPDQSLTGKATFGFVSKYKKGAIVPTGNTEFQFNAGNLNFHSNDYDWLVVTGSNYARFKGTGTIDGEGKYKFMIWAGDGTGTDGADTFRIKIWEEDESGVETVIYDNGFDQEIGGGSIVVHTK